jgi:hypothetical protein
MIIVGAGMAGLLAARMLSHRNPVIWEKQSFLPNNHRAVLRFRTSQVGDILGIPFKKVNMIKDVLPWQNPIADSLAYSFKNTGAYRSDRSVTRGLVSEERYIAPPDLISRMAEGVKIEFEREYDHLDPHAVGVPVISTMPMPVLVEHLNYDMAPDFHYRAGATITALIADCDAYVSLLVPRPNSLYSRVSITGNQLIVEVPFKGGNDAAISQWAKELDANSIARTAGNLMGIPDDGSLYAISGAKVQRYNKIIPVSDDSRKDFMFHATKHFDIYSLGRYATWRPGLLLDDLVKDIRLIDGWIGRSNYDVALRR